MIQPLERLRRLARRSEICNRLLYHMRHAYRLLAVRPDTKVVIEGYPRCANTFAVIAFQTAQPEPVRVAHHLHSVAQLRRGVRMKLPTMVLVRQPREAILSLAIRKNLSDIGWAIDEYLDFHRGVEELGDAVMLADFREVTSDFGAVTRRLNQRFGTTFGEFEHTEANVAACYRQIDDIEQDRAGGKEVRSTHVARPSPGRHEQKQRYAEQLQTPQMVGRMAEAEQLYERLCRAHSTELAPLATSHD